ncbi:MAG: FAD-binding oxidoreductase [Pyrinomonadaceae bacterium]
MKRDNRIELSGWGRYPRARASVIRPECVEEAKLQSEGSAIVRGQGRSYGDAAQTSEGVVMLTERLSRMIAFNEETGVLKAEAGVTLEEILEKFVPRGWFPSVTPGTKYVSLGGCVAADVHGKNHHREGTFGDHVRELELVLANEEKLRCSPVENAEIFRATIGGMGLTGIITEVSFQLRPVETAYVAVQHHAARNLSALLEMFEDEAFDDDYTVAWIDCLAKGAKLGRGVLMRGHHALLEELPENTKEPLRLKHRAQFNLSFDFPSWTLNAFAAAVFNELYFRRQGARGSEFISDYESFFYPLDRIGNWNRLYGRRGFVQYQCVIPAARARVGMRRLLEEIARSKYPCFLAVLKRFGAEGQGLLSFPMEGYTLALDMAVGDAQFFKFLDRLDELVLEHEGRVYLAKDARLNAATFRAMYPRLAEWQRIKRSVDPDGRFRSDLSQRLAL